MNPPWPPYDGALPAKQPADVAPRSFAVLAPPDVAVSATLDAKPSGTGELSFNLFSIADGVATVVVSGGIAGRTYTLRVVAHDNRGQVYETLAYLPMAEPLTPDPPPPVTDADFGGAVTWPFAMSFDFRNVNNSGYIALLAGF